MPATYRVEVMGQFGAMIRRVPVFPLGAVCLTKFGPESGEPLKKSQLERSWNVDRALALTNFDAFQMACASSQ